MKVLIVVDMQNDFIDGALGTPEAQAIIGKVAEKVRAAKGKGKIFFTMDTHDEDYLDTEEGKNLPVSHCIFDTQGWQVHPDLCREKMEEAYVVSKNTFGSVELAKKLTELNEKERIEEIELVGICTDICVISNALLIKAFMPDTPISVDASCCAGVTVQSHENALAAMKMCHIKIYNN